MKKIILSTTIADSPYVSTYGDYARVVLELAVAEVLSQHLSIEVEEDIILSIGTSLSDVFVKALEEEAAREIKAQRLDFTKDQEINYIDTKVSEKWDELQDKYDEVMSFISAFFSTPEMGRELQNHRLELVNSEFVNGMATFILNISEE